MQYIHYLLVIMYRPAVLQDQTPDSCQTCALNSAYSYNQNTLLLPLTVEMQLPCHHSEIQ